MPLYDYLCLKCNKTSEVLHSIHTKKRRCPECGKQSLKRQFTSPANAVFKGTGFFSTDYNKREGRG